MDGRNDYKSLISTNYEALLKEVIRQFCLEHKGYVVAKENGFDNLLRQFAEKVRAL